MKKLSAIFALLCLICMTAQAQKTATWKGGTPGKTTDWNCPTNWKEGRVPNEFSNVIIPDVSTNTFGYPLIDNGIVEVFSLQCATNARLDIKGSGRIILLDVSSETSAGRKEGIAQSQDGHGSLTAARH
jgi:hypothetical protein